MTQSAIRLGPVGACQDVASLKELGWSDPRTMDPKYVLLGVIAESPDGDLTVLIYEDGTAEYIRTSELADDKPGVYSNELVTPVEAVKLLS